MGFVDEICTDNTGALTLKQLRVTNIYFGGENLTENRFNNESLGKICAEILCEG